MMSIHPKVKVESGGDERQATVTYKQSRHESVKAWRLVFCIVACRRGGEREEIKFWFFERWEIDLEGNDR